MHDVTRLVDAYVLNALWLTPLLWASGRFAAWITRRLDTSVAHRIWVLVLFAAVLVPSLPMALPPLSRVAPWSGGIHAHFRAQIIGAWTDMPGHPALHSAFLDALSCCYAIALIVFAGRLLRSASLASALVRRARLCTLPAAFEAVRQQIVEGCLVHPRILVSDETHGPVIAGLRRSVLLLPSSFLHAIEPNDFRVTLAHECAHLARHDLLKNLLYQSLSLPIAFHPFTWLIKGQIAQTRELLCDQVAVQRCADARMYVHSLMKLALMVASGPQPSSSNVIGMNDANILEKRVMHLRAAKGNVPSALRYCLLLAGTLCVPATSLAGAAAPIALTGNEATQTGQTGKVFHVGKDVTAPVLVRQADPEFPASYQKRSGKFSGDCEVALIVDTSGTPRNVHVVRSLNEAFDKEAVKAVQQYRFKPGLRSGKPVPVNLLIDVNFQTF